MKLLASWLAAWRLRRPPEPEPLPDDAVVDTGGAFVEDEQGELIEVPDAWESWQ